MLPTEGEASMETVASVFNRIRGTLVCLKRVVYQTVRQLARELWSKVGDGISYQASERESGGLDVSVKVTSVCR